MFPCSFSLSNQEEDKYWSSCLGPRERNQELRMAEPSCHPWISYLSARTWEGNVFCWHHCICQPLYYSSLVCILMNMPAQVQHSWVQRLHDARTGALSPAWLWSSPCIGSLLRIHLEANAGLASLTWKIYEYCSEGRASEYVKLLQVQQTRVLWIWG